MCLAFQESDGPFNIDVKFDGFASKLRLMKEDIKKLSEDSFVIEIDICTPITDRRSEERWQKQRRINKRSLLG